MIKMQLLKVKVYKKEVMSGVKSGKWKVSFRMSIYGQVNGVQQALLEKSCLTSKRLRLSRTNLNFIIHM